MYDGPLAPDFIQRQQGRKPLHEVCVAWDGEPVGRLTNKSVVDPGPNGGDSWCRREVANHRLHSVIDWLSRPTDTHRIAQGLVARPCVIPTLGPRRTYDRVLRGRKGLPRIVSQLPLEEVIRVSLQRGLDILAYTPSIKEIHSMTAESCGNSLAGRTRQSPCAPREGEGATGVRPGEFPEPFLQSPWNFVHVRDFPVREGNVTNGNAQGLHLVRYPVNATWTGSRYPLPEDPATMLLRHTAGNETTPHCLPGSSVGIDTTPMGLLITTAIPITGVAGVTGGTYYTAKKK